MTKPSIISKDEVRMRFARAMSDMYRAEVPQYGRLVEMVTKINSDVLRTDGKSLFSATAQRLDLERHGAIRVGTSAELGKMRRLFAVMGMEPVGYYDLSVAGIPVHSTAFRPTDESSLQRCPFRVFTSLLRLDLIGDPALHQRASEILARRNIFTDRCLELIRQFEGTGGLTEDETREFIDQALETFRWHSQSTVDIETYRSLREVHPLVADVVCFKGPHINHLTPRVLDIDAAQLSMVASAYAPSPRSKAPRGDLSRSCFGKRAFWLLRRPWSFLVRLRRRARTLRVSGKSSNEAVR